MNTLARRAALASVASALFLGTLKAFAAIETGSVAVLASLADSVLDLVASLVTLGGVHWAMQPADEDHRFGHGKAEALAALFQVGVIAISAFAILLRAGQRLMEHQQGVHAEYGILVSMVAIFTTFALTRFQRHVIRKTRSVAIGADRIHYESDLFLNAAVIAALALDQYAGLRGADAIFGIVISMWLLFGGWRASVEAIDQLMDKEWPEEKRQRFIQVAAGHPELRGMHDLRTRTSGAKDFVQFHVWMDPVMTVLEAHDVVETLENQLGAEFPGTEILIHIDPEGHVDEPDNPLAEADLLKDQPL
ncbi:MAG: cation diffusion facilitator family transporter [Sphingomonas sp.]